MATTYRTSSEGAFTFSGKTYKIEGDTNVTFYLDDEGNVYAVSNLDGTITANFENGLTINGESVQVTGDILISVTASTDNGVTEISKLNGDEVSVVQFGSAISIITTSSGQFTIGETTFTIGDNAGATFELSDGVITGISDLSGSVTGNFSSGLNVNGTFIKIEGEENTITADSDASTITTGSGTFTITNRNFTVEGDNATFEIDEDGAITGVNNLIGSITFISNGLPFSVNGTALNIGVNDEITISTDSSGNITGVSNFDTYILNLPANTTVGSTNKNVTVNGTAISINEGTGTNYILALNSEGVPTQASGLSNGATVNNIPANMQLVTDENGAFRIGGRIYTISGDDGGVTISTDDSGKVTAVDNLDGAISFQGDATLSVNGYEVAIDKVVSAAATLSIYGGSTGIYNVYGLENGDTVTGDLNGAAISMSGDSTIYINNHTYQLSNDSDGVIIIPNENSTAIKYLSAGATFIVDSAGTYVVTNDDDETITLTLNSAGTILADSDGVISAYDSTNFILDSDSDLNTIINAIAIQPSNYTNLKSPLTIFDLDVNYNLNLAFYLNNTTAGAAAYDFSSTSLRKRVSLAGGNQNLTLNSAGDNIVVVTSTASGDKNIYLGSGGDNVIIENTNANVTVHAGTGADDIVTKSDITIATNNDGATKFSPLKNSTITLENYGVEEFYSGAGVQTTLSSILKAVKLGSISFSDGAASIDGAGAVIFDNDTFSTVTSEFANFYDKFYNISKVAFTYSNGGILDATDFTDNLILRGNYFNAEDYSGSIFGGTGNDTILAGDSDSIDAGDGDNWIEFNLANRSKSAVIFVTSRTSNDTIKNFKFGSDSTADVIRTERFYIDGMTLTDEDFNVILDLRDAQTLTIKDAVNKTVLIKNDYVADPVAIQFGNQNLTINSAVEYYWAGGADATVQVGNYSSDSLLIDLTNSDFQDREHLRFNGDIKAVNASNYRGAASIIGNDSDNIITAAYSNSTLYGGKGNDTLIGSNGADVLIFDAQHGDDFISNFNFNKDKISVDTLTVNSLTADSLGNATLKLSDGSLTFENAVGNILSVEGSSETTTYQLGYDELVIANEANYYWAGGSNATVNLANYRADSVSIDLTGSDTDALKIYGDVQNIDATKYEGAVTIAGNKNANSVTLGSGAALINYSSGGGNDTIYGVKANDTLQIINANYSTVENGEDLEVTVGKNTILLKGGAGVGLTIGGTMEGGASKTIRGTAGDDTITNTIAGAVITALGGDDSISNIGNRVTIDGGTGKDTITNNGTNANLNGGSGDDFISNTALSVTIQGGYGYDTISNTAKNASINSGDGNDHITNSGGNVTILAGKGADSVENSGDTVLIEGGDSRDSIFSSGANVTINSGDGEDFISISGGKKLIEYHNGDDNDTIAGISASDTIKITGAKYSTIVSGQNIKIKVGDGAILLRNAVNVPFTIEGTLESAEEANVLKGTSKVDSLTNAEDKYTIYGLGGSDKISNSGSSVTIVGGTGNDSIVNTGSSIVYQYASGDGDDSIYGFTAYDTLEITRGTIKSSLATGTDFILYIGAGSVTFKNIAGNSTINIKDTSGKVEKITVGKLMQGTSKSESLANARAGYQIESFAGNDRIYNYADDVTIIGGTGNDSIVNTGKNIVYKYAMSDGKDVITGFNDGDTINITRGTLSGSVISGKDLVLKIGAGSITLKDVEADTVVNILNSDGTKSKIVVPRLIQGTSRADSLTNNKDHYQIESYGGADRITNEATSCTIIAGTGNDSIINSGTKNIYQYSAGDGKDSIFGYNATDTLQILKGTIKSSVVSGEDFILNIGSGSVTFKNIAKGSKINLIDADGNASTLTVPKIKQGTAKNDTLNNTEKEYEVQGLAGNDSITNSGSSVTIVGGKGNDTLTNSGNKVIYSYASGDGKDVITNFGATDTLQITSGKVTSSVISGNDLVLNIGKGSVTVKDVVGGTINLREGTEKVVALKVPYVHVLTDKADTFTNEDANYLVDALSGNDTIENFAKNSSVDGGAGKDYLYNSGTNSSINGGVGNDSIDNFASNSTLNGGAGNDSINNTGLKVTYEYESGGGDDIVIGYGSTDTLHIVSGKVKTTNVKGMDVTFNIGSGSVTLIEAAGKTINLLNSSGNLTSTVYSGIWEGTAKADTYSNSASNILLKGLAGNDTITNYAATVTINGGAGHDIITLDKNNKNVTVIGGAGNDTVNSSSTNGILYQYAGGDGKDVITGFSKKDTIQVTSGVLKSVKTSEGNTIITIGSGTITLEKYTSTVNFVDRSGSKITVSKQVLDLFEDDNFISDDTNLNTIIESKFDLTQIQTSKVEEIEELILTYGSEK